MRRIALTLALLATPLLAKTDTSSWINPAGRDVANVKLDDSRKPVQTLSFLGVKKGDSVLDVGAGTGYYSEIMARIVGPKGKISALTPAGSVASDRIKARWATLLSTNKNVQQIIGGFDGFSATPKSYSFVLFHLEYHDLYWESARFGVKRMEPDVVLKKLFGAMKPGGIVGVIDHRGKKGDTRAIVDSTHRIDADVVKADFARAGFKLVGESQHLKLESDDYSKNVFDPAVRGKTDRFVLKFKR